MGEKQTLETILVVSGGVLGGWLGYKYISPLIGKPSDVIEVVAYATIVLPSVFVGGAITYFGYEVGNALYDKLIKNKE